MNYENRIGSRSEIQVGGYIKASEKGPVVVTKNGKPVAVLLSVQDEDEIERLLLAYSPHFQNLLQVAEEQIRAGKGIEHDEFWAQMK